MPNNHVVPLESCHKSSLSSPFSFLYFSLFLFLFSSRLCPFFMKRVPLTLQTRDIIFNVKKINEMTVDNFDTMG